MSKYEKHGNSVKLCEFLKQACLETFKQIMKVTPGPSNSTLPCEITFFHIFACNGFLMIRYRFCMINCGLQMLYDKILNILYDKCY